MIEHIAAYLDNLWFGYSFMGAFIAAWSWSIYRQQPKEEDFDDRVDDRWNYTGEAGDF